MIWKHFILYKSTSRLIMVGICKLNFYKKLYLFPTFFLEVPIENCIKLSILFWDMELKISHIPVLS